MNKYTYDVDYENGYETLTGPDGKVLAMLTEPEDRSFSRDLSSVVGELNRLYKEIEDGRSKDQVTTD